MPEKQLGASISLKDLQKGLKEGTLKKESRMKQQNNQWMCQCCCQFFEVTNTIKASDGTYYRICDSCVSRCA
jgi:hypothetical protein